MRRRKAKKKLLTVFLPGNYFMKLRLVSWMRTPTGTIWLASLAVGKSKRQLNDWMSRRTKTKRVKCLDSNLTGRLTVKLMLQVMEQVHIWCDELNNGDMFVFNCESAEPQKQFRVWGKWLSRKERGYTWIPNNELLSFYFYKHVNLE
jgi:hypothetical protein